jgi:protein-L-isoaspartate(D-aspartate) O-methyltransferase
MAGWVSMQCGCNISKSYRKLLSRSPRNESARADTDRTPARIFLRSAGRAASVLTLLTCAAARPPCGQGEVSRPGGDATVSQDDSTRIAREAMVQEQIAGRGVKNAAVLAAMRRVPRHKFMPEAVRRFAYDDRPVPIGMGQTISQPYIVALMTELAAVGRGSRVLEIGTGSGYQAAVLAELGADVYSIEILAPLRERAVEILVQLGYAQVKTRVGDGYLGWPEAAPFDAIIVTAAPARVPEPLKQQLKVGGRLVLPVGKVDQELEVIARMAVGFSEESVIPVRFVPMTGKAGTETR